LATFESIAATPVMSMTTTLRAIRADAAQQLLGELAARAAGR
jgi:hypothetical protein